MGDLPDPRQPQSHAALFPAARLVHPEKSWNTLSRKSSGMPQPVSLISIIASSPRRDTAAHTLPPGRLYFTPFSTRLKMARYTPDDFPKSSKVGAFLPRPPPFCEKTSVSAHQKSRKGTNPIRPNDATPSFFPIRRIAFVYTALYSDVPPVQTCKKNHPSFVSKLGWLYVK